MSLVEVFAVYFLYVIGTTTVIWRYGAKERGPLIVVAIVMPFILVMSFLIGTFRLLFGSSPRVRPCPVGLDRAELAVEFRRQEMFGGSLVEPRFASEWARLYGVTLAEEAEKVKRFAHRHLAFA